MVNREQIDQVRAGVDIVEVIREYVPSLKSAGRSVKGLCPFHSEKSASFHVHPEKGLYKCFGCGEAGDVIAFIVKMEQVGFSDALQMLADRAGIRLERNVAAKPEVEGIREKLFRVLESARGLYEQQLWDERTGQVARAYLDGRGIREDTSRWFRLGFAASGGNAVFEQLVKKGFSIELCQQAGLASRSAAGRFYDPMFGRLVFPILDSFGHVIGFGGRVLPAGKRAVLGGDGSTDEGPKYLNSPDSPVFSKGKSLYGLFQAKSNILAARSVIILEGYMDVIGVHQGGVQTAVATLGTAFTRDHAKLLKRYADETIAFFDPDEAGQKAAMRSLEPMLQEGFFPRVVLTADTGDPDEIIQEKGREYFESLIKAAPDFVDFALQNLRGSESGLQHRSAVGAQLVGLVSQSPNEILKSEWLSRIGKGLDLRTESLQRELGRSTPVPQAAKPFEAPKRKPLPNAEEEYFQLLINHPGLPGFSLGVDDFTSARDRKLMEILNEQRTRGKVSAAGAADELGDEHREWLLSLSTEDREYSEPAEREAQLALDVRLKRRREKLDALGERIRSGNATQQETADYLEVLKQVKGSQGRTAPLIS